MNIEDAKKRLDKMPVASPQQEAIKNAVGAVIEIGESLNLVVTKLSKRVYDLEELLRGGAGVALNTGPTPFNLNNTGEDSIPKATLDGSILHTDPILTVDIPVDEELYDPTKDCTPEPEEVNDTPDDEAPSIPNWRKELNTRIEK